MSREREGDDDNEAGVFFLERGVGGKGSSGHCAREKQPKRFLRTGCLPSTSSQERGREERGERRWVRVCGAEERINRKQQGGERGKSKERHNK